MTVVTGLELALPSSDELMMMRPLPDATTSQPAESAFCNPRSPPAARGGEQGLSAIVPSPSDRVPCCCYHRVTPLPGRKCSAYSAGRGSDTEALFQSAVMASYDMHFAVIN